VSDPFAVLGLGPTATLDELRAARRALAQRLHPDVGGDGAEMQRVNEAFDRCVGHVTGRRPLTPPAPGPPEPGPAATDTPPATRRRFRPSERGGRFRGIEHDSPSFTIDALPAESFEALLLVAAIIGDVVDDDPPYVLECVLDEPLRCWCRLELVPDAGGSTVSLMVSRAAERSGSGVDHPAPTAEEVRDLWVEQLNQLGRQQP
jgi:hypothetical protein